VCSDLIRRRTIEGEIPVEARAIYETVQLRLMDGAAGAAWPDDPLRAAQARAVLRVLGGCGLRVAELADAARSDLVPARPSAADRAALEGRDVAGWSLGTMGTEFGAKTGVALRCGRLGRFGGP
jgi:hypothetical protein